MQVAHGVDLLQRAPGGELHREHLPVRGVVATPSRGHEHELRLVLGDALRGKVTVEQAAAVSAEEDEMADPIGMARRVLDCGGDPLRMAEKREGLGEARGIHHGLEIANVGLEGELDIGGVRKAAGAQVHAQQPVLGRQRCNPRLPQRAVELVLEVGEPVGRLDQRRAAPRHRKGDARAVGIPAEADGLGAHSGEGYAAAEASRHPFHYGAKYMA